MTFIGWEVVGPGKGKKKAEQVRLVWQPNQGAIEVSYERLLTEGYNEDDIEIRQVTFQRVEEEDESPESDKDNS